MFNKAEFVTRATLIIGLALWLAACVEQTPTPPPDALGLTATAVMASFMAPSASETPTPTVTPTWTDLPPMSGTCWKGSVFDLYIARARLGDPDAAATAAQVPTDFPSKLPTCVPETPTPQPPTQQP